MGTRKEVLLPGHPSNTGESYVLFRSDDDVELFTGKRNGHATFAGILGMVIHIVLTKHRIRQKLLDNPGSDSFNRHHAAVITMPVMVISDFTRKPWCSRN